MKGLRHALMCIVLALLSVVEAGAQSPVLLAYPQPREVTVADGLPSSTINAITEDHSGYLWLASADGLARFDGRDYRIWRNEDGLRDNFLWSLHVDDDNRLWVGTRNAGLIQFSPDRRQLRYIDRESYPELRSNTIFAITSTPDGALWFGTDTAGLYRLDTSGRLKSFVPETGNPNSLPSLKVGQLLVDRQGSLWVGTDNGLARWNGTGFDRIDLHPMSDVRIDSLQLDQQGRLWVGTPGGAVVRDPDGQVRLPGITTDSGEDVISLMLQDRRGEYWLEFSRSFKRSPDGIHTEPLHFYSAVAEDVILKNFTLVYEDRDGGLWFSMRNGGLWRLPANWRQFVQIRGKKDSPQGLHNPRVEAISRAADGGLWLVGTAGDLDHLDPVTGKVTHHIGSKPGDMVMRSVIEDPHGRVWIGRSDEMERYEPATGRVKRWSRHTVDAALRGATRKMVLCDNRHLWMMSGEDGVQLRDLEGRVQWESRQSGGRIDGNHILDLACGPDQQPWLGTRSGLLRWNADRQAFEPVPGSPDFPVHSMHLDNHSVLWLGQVGALSQHRWRKGRLEQVDRIDGTYGFPAVIPEGIVTDAHGVIWVASRRGLMRVDPITRGVRVFGVHDGLRSQEFVPGTLGVTESGQVFASTDYGVVLVDHEEFFQMGRRPPLVVEKISARLEDEQVDLTHMDPLTITHDMRDVQITARLLSFVDSSGTSYRFKLSGYDSDWVDVGSSGQRLFSRLEHGTYQLMVQARTVDNSLTEVSELQIQVLPPWWKSKAGVVVYLLLGAVCLGAGVLGYRRRVQRLGELALARTRREVAEQASQAKTRFLANFGHEVRTPLTGVLGMSELLLSSSSLPAREKGYARSIQQAGEHLLRLVNDALDLARIEAGKLELRIEPVAVQSLLDQVMELMRPLARNKRLLLRQQTRLQDNLLVQADALRLRQIALNLIGNAIKFTEEGSVVIDVGVIDGGEGFWLEVMDTGPGMTEAQQKRLFQRFEQADGALTTQRYGGSGLGLAISQELAAAMGGRIQVRSRVGEGSCFRVEMPLPWSHLAKLAPMTDTDETSQAVLQILLVEDDPTIAEVICGLLSERGHVVVHAAHGLGALAELVGAPFDIALLDLDLPGMDGLALAAQIRHLGLRLPLLAVTARADAEARLLVEAAGFQGFLRKPVTGQMLVQAIEQALSEASVLASGRSRAPVGPVAADAPH